MSASPFYQAQSFNTPGLSRQLLLQQRAHYMRFAPTPSEALLWRHLRGRQLGVQFRRQVVLGNFIVDFCAPTAALIIEVDGEDYHATRVSADQRRLDKLIRAGYTVLRFPVSVVEADVEGVLRLVRGALARTC